METQIKDVKNLLYSRRLLMMMTIHTPDISYQVVLRRLRAEVPTLTGTVGISVHSCLTINR